MSGFAAVVVEELDRRIGIGNRVLVDPGRVEGFDEVRLHVFAAIDGRSGPDPEWATTIGRRSFGNALTTISA
jgi:hypothetical protein